MSATWTITAAAPEVTLGADGRAEAGFTVTNAGPGPDRAVVDVVPAEGADRAWFAVSEPQRAVPAGASVSYLVTIAVPAGTPPAQHWVAARVWSADATPEETSVLSNRVAFTVAAPEAPPRRRPLWIIAALVALVVVVLGVVGFLVLRNRDATVPNLVGRTVEEAAGDLRAVGLVLGAQRHRQQPADVGRVVEQASAVNTTMAAGSAVDAVVGVDLADPADPAVTTTRLGPTAYSAQFTWAPVPGAGGYRIEVLRQTCGFAGCDIFLSVPTQDTTVTAETVQIEFAFNDTGLVQWRVAALDDFGTPGRSTPDLVLTLDSH